MNNRFCTFTSCSFTLCLFAMVLSLCAPLLAAPVRVAGVVVDETNHRPAAGAEVELVRAGDGKSSPVAKARTDAQGRFAFPQQNPGPNEILVVRAKWSDYTYVAPAYDGTGNLAEMNVKMDPGKIRLAVYETTTSLVPLTFTAHHLAIESRPGGLKCVERIVVENPTRKTFMGLGERNATLLLNLPKGAKNVELDPQVTDAKLEERPDGWAVLKPIPPSSYDPRILVIINYDMDWPSALPWERRLDFSRRVQYPTKFFFVARTSQDEKMEVTAPKLSEPQTAPLNIAGQMETRIVNAIGNPGHAPGATAEPALASGEELQIEVAAPVNPLFWGFLGFVVLLCLAVPVALWKKGSPTAPAPDKMAEPHSPAGVNSGTFAPESSAAMLVSDAGSRELIERIAVWDEQFENGKIGQSEYLASRSAWKSELVEQLLQSKNPQEAVVSQTQEQQQKSQQIVSVENSSQPDSSQPDVQQQSPQIKSR